VITQSAQDESHAIDLLLACWSAGNDGGCLAALQRLAPQLRFVRGCFAGPPVWERCAWHPQTRMLPHQGQLRCEVAEGHPASAVMVPGAQLRSWPGVDLPLCTAALGVDSWPSGHAFSLPDGRSSALLPASKPADNMCATSLQTMHHVSQKVDCHSRSEIVAVCTIAHVTARPRHTSTHWFVQVQVKRWYHL
jgi:hypothetical protein